MQDTCAPLYACICYVTRSISSYIGHIVHVRGEAWCLCRCVILSHWPNLSAVLLGLSCGSIGLAMWWKTDWNGAECCLLYPVLEGDVHYFSKFLRIHTCCVRALQTRCYTKGSCCHRELNNREALQAGAILAAFVEETSQLGNTENNRKITIVYLRYGELLWVSFDISACFVQINEVNSSRSWSCTCFSWEQGGYFFLCCSELVLEISCRTIDLFPFARHSGKLNVYERKFQVWGNCWIVMCAGGRTKKVIELENHCLVLGFFWTWKCQSVSYTFLHLI